jgi:hypothetical protein
VIEAKWYEPAFAGLWDEFIESRARNATFLHTRKFFSHNDENEKEDRSLLFYQGNSLVAVLPACLVPKDGRKIFQSHPRATYGGFVVSRQVGVEMAVEIVDLTITRAESLGATELVIRNPFRIFHQTPSDETDYAMWHRGFTVRAREIEIVLTLEGHDATSLFQSFDSNARWGIRKAEKSGVVVKVSDDYETFWTLLIANLESKHGTKPTHTLAQFQRLRKLLPLERIQMFGAYLGEDLIAGMVLFVTSVSTVHAQYIASREGFQGYQPVNALIFAAALWALNNGTRYFNLGTANEDGGKIFNPGLFKFKEAFGGAGLLRETMGLSLEVLNGT